MTNSDRKRDGEHTWSDEKNKKKQKQKQKRNGNRNIAPRNHHGYGSLFPFSDCNVRCVCVCVKKKEGQKENRRQKGGWRMRRNTRKLMNAERNGREKKINECTRQQRGTEGKKRKVEGWILFFCLFRYLWLPSFTEFRQVSRPSNSVGGQFELILLSNFRLLIFKYNSMYVAFNVIIFLPIWVSFSAFFHLILPENLVWGGGGGSVLFFYFLSLFPPISIRLFVKAGLRHRLTLKWDRVLYFSSLSNVRNGRRVAR